MRASASSVRPWPTLTFHRLAVPSRYRRPSSSVTWTPSPLTSVSSAERTACMSANGCQKRESEEAIGPRYPTPSGLSVTSWTRRSAGAVETVDHTGGSQRGCLHFRHRGGQDAREAVGAGRDQLQQPL